MKKVKVYNIRKFMEREFKEHNMTTFGCDDSLAIVSNDKGKCFVIDREGVFGIHETLQDKVTIGLVAKQPKGSNRIPIIATHSCQLLIEGIMKECEFKEMALGDFIRKFGDRLEYNYATIIRHITSDLGMDGMEYDNGRFEK